MAPAFKVAVGFAVVVVVSALVVGVDIVAVVMRPELELNVAVGVTMSLGSEAKQIHTYYYV